MNKQAQVVIATTTFYQSKSEVRARCALRLIDEATQKGYGVVVVDGGSPPKFCEAAGREGVSVYRASQSGMGASRRQAIALALRAEVIVWTEPEKYPLVRDLDRVVAPIQEDRADLVIPQRWSLESYPPLQQLAEKFGNAFFNQLIGFNGMDPWFGPRAMNQDAARYFLDYPGTYGDKWDSIFVPLVRARAAGLRLASVEVDYIHPPEQTAEEEESTSMTYKRYMQLANLIPALRGEAQALGLAS